MEPLDKIGEVLRQAFITVDRERTDHLAYLLGVAIGAGGGWGMRNELLQAARKIPKRYRINYAAGYTVGQALRLDAWLRFTLGVK